MAVKNTYTESAFMSLVGLLKRTGHQFVGYTENGAMFADILVVRAY